MKNQEEWGEEESEQESDGVRVRKRDGLRKEEGWVKGARGVG